MSTIDETRATLDTAARDLLETLTYRCDMGQAFLIPDGTGWRLVAYRPGDSVLAAMDAVAGDTVRALLDERLITLSDGYLSVPRFDGQTGRDAHRQGVTITPTRNALPGPYPDEHAPLVSPAAFRPGDTIRLAQPETGEPLEAPFVVDRVVPLPDRWVRVYVDTEVSPGEVEVEVLTLPVNLRGRRVYVEPEMRSGWWDYRLYDRRHVEYDRLMRLVDEHPRRPNVVVHRGWMTRVTWPIANDDGVFEGVFEAHVERKTRGHRWIAHRLNGVKYPSDDAANRAMFEAGLTAFKVWEHQRAHFGLA